MSTLVYEEEAPFEAQDLFDYAEAEKNNIITSGMGLSKAEKIAIGLEETEDGGVTVDIPAGHIFQLGCCGEKVCKIRERTVVSDEIKASLKVGGSVWCTMAGERRVIVRPPPGGTFDPTAFVFYNTMRKKKEVKKWKALKLNRSSLSNFGYVTTISIEPSDVHPISDSKNTSFYNLDRCAAERYHLIALNIILHALGRQQIHMEIATARESNVFNPLRTFGVTQGGGISMRQWGMSYKPVLDNTVADGDVEGLKRKRDELKRKHEEIGEKLNIIEGKLAAQLAALDDEDDTV
ncbi:hypothetical protein TrRE_jg3209 [Triparma retinervis]|uniref:Uncharacterized protein n=1 Tax=Triparma retinervis TaxID=2557542 RepID=A0A9W6ZDL5_9STRA|nr:hypothetical protein TrRE_jg3209 [Triparma retinervis]